MKPTDTNAVCWVLAPNHCSLHDGKLIHGTDSNPSDIRRGGHTMRHISTRVKSDSEKYPRHPVYLARGRDHAGNTCADPAKSHAELMKFRLARGQSVH
jgi:hypothetical protein